MWELATVRGPGPECPLPGPGKPIGPTCQLPRLPQGPQDLETRTQWKSKSEGPPKPLQRRHGTKSTPKGC